jgi:hypothetical protein
MKDIGNGCRVGSIIINAERYRAPWIHVPFRHKDGRTSYAVWGIDGAEYSPDGEVLRVRYKRQPDGYIRVGMGALDK